jgi:hypothetical protein
LRCPASAVFLHRGAPKRCPADVVRDANDQALSYVYSRANEAEAMQAKVLTEDEARRIATNIAKLPALLGRERHSDGA